MKMIKSIACTGLMALSLMNVAHATPLTVKLTAHQLVNEDGKTVQKPVSRANKGDVILYQAVATNTLQKPMTDIGVTIPVPTGMVYTGVSTPNATFASLDGKTFAPIPLKRQVKGKWVEVPLKEYKAVRFVIKTLPAQTASTVSIQVKVP